MKKFEYIIFLLNVGLGLYLYLTGEYSQASCNFIVAILIRLSNRNH